MKWPLSSLWGLCLSLSACATEYDLDRPNTREGQSVGVVSHEVLVGEAALSAQSPEAKVARLEVEREAWVSALDAWLDWPQLHALSDELYAWGFLYDEPTPRVLLRALAAHLERLSQDEALLTRLMSPELNARLNAVSPYAPSLLTPLLSPGFGGPLSALLEWAAAHDNFTSPQLPLTERSGHLYALLVYLNDALRRAEPLPPLALSALELLWSELPASSLEPHVLSAPLDPKAPIARRFEIFTDHSAPHPDSIQIDTSWSQPIAYQARGHRASDLRLSVAYTLSAGAGAWWSEGALGALQDLLEALLPEPYLAPEPLLRAQAWRYPGAPTLERLAEALLDLIDHPVTPPLLGYLSEGLPSGAPLIARLLTDLDTLSERVEERDPPELGEVLWRERSFAPDLIEALADLLLFKGDITVRLPYEEAQARVEGSTGARLTAHEATLAMSAGLMQSLTDSALLQLPRVSALMMASHAPSELAARALPPLGGAYDQCALSCEIDHHAEPVAHLLCLEGCPRGALLTPQASNDLSTQSAFERSLALIRDFMGHPYEMRVTHFSSDLSSALNGVIEPELLPPLLEIEDVGASFLSSVIGELELASLVSPSAINHPEVELLLEGFDLLCEEGSLSNDLLNNLLPRLTTISRETLDERCRRFVDVRGLGDTEEAKRSQVAVLVTMLSLLTDVPMSERPRTGELIRFFNLERPAVYLGVLDLELSRLTCAQGYPLRDHHGYALYAGEAAGLYQALSPLIKLAHRYHKLPELVRLLGALYTHYGTDERPHYDASRRREPSAGTGLVYLEPTLEVVLSGDEAPSLLNTLSELLSDQRLNEVLEIIDDWSEVELWRAEGWPELKAQLGVSEALWGELRAASASRGEPVWREEGAPLTRASLMVGALLERALTRGAGPSMQGRLMALWRATDALLDDLEADPSREEAAREALERLWAPLKTLFERRGGVSPQLASTRPLEVGALATHWLASQLAEHMAERSPEAEPLWTEASLVGEVLSHPATFSALALARDLRESEAGRSLDALLAPLWVSPLELTIALYRVSTLATYPDLMSALAPLAPLLDPREAPQLPQELITLLVRITRESTWTGWAPLLSAGLTPPSLQGAQIEGMEMSPLGEREGAPLFEAGSVMMSLLRLNPRSEEPWAVSDARAALQSLAQWLQSDQTGLVKALEMISTRVLEPPAP